MNKEKIVSWIDIDYLKLSQIYLSQEKLDCVRSWFTLDMRSFNPVCARDFLCNGNLHITDGHTRAFVAWQNGIKKIPHIYDFDDIVTCELGQLQYEEDIVWCERFGLKNIADLSDRILSKDDYEELWRGRCGKKYDLLIALQNGSLDKESYEHKHRKIEEQGLFVYGISEDLKCLCCESKSGELFEIEYNEV